MHPLVALYLGWGLKQPQAVMAAGYTLLIPAALVVLTTTYMLTVTLPHWDYFMREVQSNYVKTIMSRVDSLIGAMHRVEKFLQTSLPVLRDRIGSDTIVI